MEADNNNKALFVLESDRSQRACSLLVRIRETLFIPPPTDPNRQLRVALVLPLYFHRLADEP
jgi:hypothetical protein